jgi:hypothetical protein
MKIKKEKNKRILKLQHETNIELINRLDSIRKKKFIETFCGNCTICAEMGYTEGMFDYCPYLSNTNYTDIIKIIQDIN